MNKLIAVSMTALLVLAVAACSASPVEVVPGVSVVADSSSTSTDATVAATAVASVVEAQAENSAPSVEAGDFAWDSAAVIAIQLNGDAISADGAGVTVEGGAATITAPGTYSLSGALADGQIVVNTNADGIVRLILNGVDLRSASSAPIYIENAEKTVIVLADGTVNHLTDAAEYVFVDPEEAEPSAALFSNSDLTIGGNGSLTVTGNYGDGIATDDGLVIAGGTLTITAADDGLRGKDYLVIENGNLTVTAQANGLKSDDEEDATRGYIAIENGTIAVTAGGDAIQAQTDVLITAGALTLFAGGGHASRLAADTSAKGLKGAVSVVIDGGTFSIDAADDAVHSNGSVVINGGDFVIATGDDGVHADATLDINGGQIEIADSFEGLESAVITINAGELHIVSSDDGLNVAAGNDGSGTQWMGPGGGGPGRGPGSGPGQDAFNYTGDYYLYIHGGTVVVDADGDGLDINGAIEMTGGVVLVNGPTENMNGALDYDGGFKMTGGLLVAAGSAGMAQAPDQGSSQYSILVNLASAQPEGTLVYLETSAGEDVLTFAPNKPYQSVAFSSPALAQGVTYSLYLGGSSTGAETDGLYQGGTYSGGTEYTSFTLSGIVTRIGGNFR